MTQTYTVRVGREKRMRFSADFAQASSPIMVLDLDNDDNPDSTPFQVADARHRESEAVELLNVYLGNNGGAPLGGDEDWTVEADVAE